MQICHSKPKRRLYVCTYCHCHMKDPDILVEGYWIIDGRRYEEGGGCLRCGKDIFLSGRAKHHS